MFSIFSLFTRSPSRPTLPVSSVDATLISSPSRSSVRERVRAAWQSFVIVVISIFAGGMAPASDIEVVQPSVTGTQVVPELSTPSPSVPTLAEIPVCTPLSPTFQPQGRTAAAKDSNVSGFDTHPPSPAPRVQGLAHEEPAISAPALRVVDSIPVTPELGLAITVPELMLSPAPSKARATPVRFDWDLLVPLLPEGRASRLKASDNHLPALSSSKTAASSKTPDSRHKTKSQGPRPGRAKSEVTPGAAYTSSLNSTPIADADIFESILSYYIDNPTKHEVTLPKTDGAIEDTSSDASGSSMRSASPSDTESSLFDRSMNSSLTTIDATEAPSAADSPSESLLSTSVCLQDQSVCEVKIEQAVKSQPASSVQPPSESKIDSCYAWALSLYFDEINPESEVAQDTQVEAESQAYRASASPAFALVSKVEDSDKSGRDVVEVEQDQDVDNASVWSLVSHYPAQVGQKTELVDATEPSLPTENTSSTLSDIANPFRYDTKPDLLWADGATDSKQVMNNAQGALTTEPTDPKSKSGLPTDNSSSTIADLADPFRYDTNRSCKEEILDILADYAYQGDDAMAASNNERKLTVSLKGLPSESLPSAAPVPTDQLSHGIDNDSKRQTTISGSIGIEQGCERIMPTQDTSSTIADLADPFRYDTNRNSTSSGEEILTLLANYEYPNLKSEQDFGPKGLPSNSSTPEVSIPGAESLSHENNDSKPGVAEAKVQKQVVDGSHTTMTGGAGLEQDLDRAILTENTSSTIADSADPFRNDTNRGFMTVGGEILDILAEYEDQEDIPVAPSNSEIGQDGALQVGGFPPDNAMAAISAPANSCAIGNTSINTEGKAAQEHFAAARHTESGSARLEQVLKRCIPAKNTSSTIADLADPFRYDTNHDWMDCEEEILDILTDYEHRDNGSKVSGDSKIEPGASLGEPQSDSPISTVPVAAGPLHSNTKHDLTDVGGKVSSRQAIITYYSAEALPVAVSGTIRVEQSPKHGFPTEDTSSTLADMLDPFRYDTSSDWLNISDMSVGNQSSDGSQDPSVSSGLSPSGVAEDQGSTGLSSSSSSESAILPVEHDRKPISIVSDLPATTSPNSLSAEPPLDRVNDTRPVVHGSKVHPKSSLPRLRIQIPSDSLPSIPDIKLANYGQDASKSDLDAAQESLLSPPLTPARNNPLQGILKKDKKQMNQGKSSSKSASANSNSRSHSVSGIPTRSTPNPILPSKEDRRSASSTASSRLKKRETMTYFVFRSEPPPMPALPFPLPPKSPATVYRSTTPLTPVSPVGSRLKLRTPPESPKLDSSPPPIPYIHYDKETERKPELSLTQANSHHNHSVPVAASSFLKCSPLRDNCSAKTTTDKGNQTDRTAHLQASGLTNLSAARIDSSRIPTLVCTGSSVGRRSSSPLGSIPESTHTELHLKSTQTPTAVAPVPPSSRILRPTKDASRSRRMGMSFERDSMAQRLDELPWRHDFSNSKLPASNEHLISAKRYTNSKPTPRDHITPVTSAMTPMSGGPAASHPPVENGKSTRSPGMAHNDSSTTASDCRLTPVPERRPEMRAQDAGAYLASARAALQASIQSEHTAPQHKSNLTKSKRGASSLSQGQQHSRLNT